MAIIRGIPNFVLIGVVGGGLIYYFFIREDPDKKKAKAGVGTGL